MFVNLESENRTEQTLGFAREKIVCVMTDWVSSSLTGDLL